MINQRFTLPYYSYLAATGSTPTYVKNFKNIFSNYLPSNYYSLSNFIRNNILLGDDDFANKINNLPVLK
jgi:hypothetical protein